jgi:DNA-binding transcriptional regulator YiaG
MIRTPPVPTWLPIRAVQKVVIPTPDGQGIAYTLDHEVDAWRDSETGETYLDGHAIEELDRVKARHLGVLAPEELRGLRHSLGLTQRELSGLLQIGEKSWTRWETGRERPSRSMNVLLRALKDGRVDSDYLRTLRALPSPGPVGYGSGLQLAPALAVCEPEPLRSGASAEHRKRGQAGVRRHSPQRTQRSAEDGSQ